MKTILKRRQKHERVEKNMSGFSISHKFSLKDKVTFIFSDVETAGKKQGYLRAAKEYETAFLVVEHEYQQVKELLMFQRENYSQRIKDLKQQLSLLETQKMGSTALVEQQVMVISSKYKISLDKVCSALATGTLLTDLFFLDIISKLYNNKMRKMKKAEQNGYIRAKKVYDDKITYLRQNLAESKEIGDAGVNELMEIINELLESITEKQTQLAQMRILLQEVNVDEL